MVKHAMQHKDFNWFEVELSRASTVCVAILKADLYGKYLSDAQRVCLSVHLLTWPTGEAGLEEGVEERWLEAEVEEIEKAEPAADTPDHCVNVRVDHEAGEHADDTAVNRHQNWPQCSQEAHALNSTS
ncbi:hypothetical protein KIN20_003101 [Parelaphostrongylus tenuis]|uniref:Uncharacterized protein n=1 Tax=Parelaphostrongylus tenuis TaxID=148309 RepID=A0AAD5QIC2_PARTN|nr:hypothetical protein KIN20_003101 [Parelaphostrongylus tenuis]